MVLKYAKQFDSNKARAVADLEIHQDACEASLQRISTEHREALHFASKRIGKFHELQMRNTGNNWEHTDDAGMLLGSDKIPLQSVGIYVPGGNAIYPSTVLMSAIPARMAGVKKLIMMTPGRQGVCDDLVLAAAKLASIDRIYCIGGAQAIGAMAYGTETINPVNKIVGPGNRYICAAKSIVRDQVGIDTIAGPSELLIVADETANPKWVALDLCAQAEHDADARATLISTSSTFINSVTDCMNDLLPTLRNQDTIAQALSSHGTMIHVSDLDTAFHISNDIAPEHLSIMVRDSMSWLIKVHHAGAIFIGGQVAQVLGDYCAGPSHVLPTGGRARFDSGLSVNDFYRYSSVVSGKDISAEMYQTAAVLAHAEGLEAHARAAESRLEALNASSNSTASHS